MTVNRFDESASTWDNNPQRVAVMRKVGEAVLRECQPTNDMDVLEYGCGTGLVGLFLMPHVRTVTGADDSAGMLQVLQKKITEARIGNMKTIRLNLERDSVPADRFHMIVVGMTMHHIERIDKVLRAFHQLLLPDGVLAVADLDTEPGTFHSSEAAEYVYHHGFDREVFKGRLAEIGFHEARDTTVVSFEKPVDGNRTETFSIFLISARR